MRRQFFSAARPCPYRCLYCFTTLPGYEPQPQLFQLSQLKDYTLVYPSCDGELPLDSVTLARLEALIPQCSKPLVVSLSTKAPLSAAKLKVLSGLNESLRSRDGFLKISVGFTTASQISVIEPGAAELTSRIRNLALLVEHQIPCAVTIKPILPFIPLLEYEGLVQAARAYTDHYLLGDLYVDVTSDFYKNYVATSKSSFRLSRRVVGWLDSSPSWAVAECEDTKRSLSNFIVAQGAVAFENDLALVNSLWTRYMEVYRGSARLAPLGY